MLQGRKNRGLWELLFDGEEGVGGGYRLTREEWRRPRGPVFILISIAHVQISRNKFTSIKPQPYFFSKIIIAIGANTALPTKHNPPSFQAFSLSLVLAYTLNIKKRM